VKLKEIVSLIKFFQGENMSDNPNNDARKNMSDSTKI